MNALASTRSSACFATEFGAPLPRALRDDAATMNWSTFTARYCHTTGPIRLGSWAARPTSGGRRIYDATLGFGDSITSCTATSFGAIEALTSMLYDAGVHIEIFSFHQIEAGRRTATFVECDTMGRREWSMALDDNAIESSIRAIIGAANMLQH